MLGNRRGRRESTRSAPAGYARSGLDWQARCLLPAALREVRRQRVRCARSGATLAAGFKCKDAVNKTARVFWPPCGRRSCSSTLPDPDVALYRVFRLWQFDELVRMGHLWLTLPGNWEDPYELILA